MIYKFKSRETGDLIMLAPDAERILTLLGKVLKAPGIITHADIASAKATLQAAALVASQQAAQNALTAEAEGDDAGKQTTSVSLTQRLVPFLAMLDRCQAAKVDVVWSV
ncbi:MAG: DUF1840 domain-containing protein [Burkholderiales bacterium]|jgi:cyclopropane-fatty-acyl-phospholipid synthase|nr:DUF1840 domain-containing protein [Burkholderiales bacterium]